MFTCALPPNLNRELVWRVNFASLSAQDVRVSFTTSVDNVGSQQAVRSTYGDYFQFTLISSNPIIVSSLSVNSSAHMDGALVECSGTLSIRAGPLDKNQSRIHIVSGRAISILLSHNYYYTLAGLPMAIASQSIRLANRSVTEMNQTLALLEWNESFGATQYYVLIESSDSSNLNFSRHIAVNTTPLILSLPHNVEYRVCIWAANCNGNSSEPSIATITTGNSCHDH